jgi:ABC-type branched-subunit amino acid transport system permease subunit
VLAAFFGVVLGGADVRLRGDYLAITSRHVGAKSSTHLFEQSERPGQYHHGRRA